MDGPQIEAGIAVEPGNVESGRKRNGQKWFKEWVPQETIWSSGKCLILKWVTEDTLNAVKAKQAEGEQADAAEEHEVVFLCTFKGCGKVFNEQASLKKHAHVHGEKQFACKFEGCGKKFMDSSKLKRHNLIHTGEKHFMCPFEGCGKAFSLDFNLKTHVRTHTGENYHRCPVEDCGKQYAHEYKLKKHMKVYHDKRFSSTKAEPSHGEKEVAPAKIVTPAASPATATLERPFVCPYSGCSKRYMHVYKLNLHLKREHLEEERPGRSSDGEEEVGNSSDREATSSGKPHEGAKASGSKIKLKITSKPASAASRKRSSARAPPSERTAKRQATTSSRKKKPAPNPKQQVLQQADSEETLDEDGQPKTGLTAGLQMPADDAPDFSDTDRLIHRPKASSRSRSSRNRKAEEEEDTEDDIDY